MASPDGTSRFSRFIKAIEVPIDKDAYYRNNTWANRDLIPIPPERRTYGPLSYALYWTMAGACIGSWTIGSTLLAQGLNAQYAIGSVVVGSFIIGVLAALCGFLGEVHRIGYTVSTRMSWGMRLAYALMVLRGFVSCIWLVSLRIFVQVCLQEFVKLIYRLQPPPKSFWGGQAVRVTLGALITGLAHMENTLPASSVIETRDLIGLFIWYAMFVPLLLVPPEKLQRFFTVSFFLFTGTMIGLLAWAVSNADGAGPLFKQPPTTNQIGWSFILGITSVLGSWGGGVLGQSDWTRYSKRRWDPSFSQMIAAPATITLTATLGIIVTSAGQQIVGELYWSPIELLGAIQDHYQSSPRARAGIFFAGLGCVSTQLMLGLVINAVSTGMDIAGLAPRFLNIRRGATLMACIGLASNPWQILSRASTFLSVLSGFGVISAPMTGIMISDYLVVRRLTLKIEDLYLGGPKSIYWYSRGFNWRSPVAFFIGMIPLLPGMAISIREPETSNAWTKLFRVTYFYGIGSAALVFIIINKIWPPKGLGEGLNYLDDENPPEISGEDYPVDELSKAEKVTEMDLSVQ